jgi:hypothetical protein
MPVRVHGELPNWPEYDVWQVVCVAKTQSGAKQNAKSTLPKRAMRIPGDQNSRIPIVLRQKDIRWEVLLYQNLSERDDQVKRHVKTVRRRPCNITLNGRHPASRVLEIRSLSMWKRGS